jgi:hypothetical protein
LEELREFEELRGFEDLRELGEFIRYDFRIGGIEELSEIERLRELIRLDFRKLAEF